MARGDRSTTQEVIAVESIYLQAALPTNVLNGGDFACRIPRSPCAGRKLSLKENLVHGLVDLEARRGETEKGVRRRRRSARTTSRRTDVRDNPDNVRRKKKETSEIFRRASFHFSRSAVIVNVAKETRWRLYICLTP